MPRLQRDYSDVTVRCHPERVERAKELLPGATVVSDAKVLERTWCTARRLGACGVLDLKTGVLIFDGRPEVRR